MFKEDPWADAAYATEHPDDALPCIFVESLEHEPCVNDIVKLKSIHDNVVLPFSVPGPEAAGGKGKGKDGGKDKGDGKGEESADDADFLTGAPTGSHGGKGKGKDGGKNKGDGQGARSGADLFGGCEKDDDHEASFEFLIKEILGADAPAMKQNFLWIWRS